MSCTNRRDTATVWEGSDVALMARVKNVAGQNVTVASISSVSVKVFRSGSGEQVGSADTPSPASVIYDTLQTGGGWAADATGYNFRYVLDGTDYLYDGDEDYRVEITLTPVSGSPFALVFDVSTKNLYSS